VLVDNGSISYALNLITTHRATITVLIDQSGITVSGMDSASVYTAADLAALAKMLSVAEKLSFDGGNGSTSL
jgi:hypothetical protein